MKLSESHSELKKLILLIAELRPDQAQNFLNPKWFADRMASEFPDVEMDFAKKVLEAKLTYYEGPIIISTVFNWMKEMVEKQRLLDARNNGPSRKDYYAG